MARTIRATMRASRLMEGAPGYEAAADDRFIIYLLWMPTCAPGLFYDLSLFGCFEKYVPLSSTEETSTFKKISGITLDFHVIWSRDRDFSSRTIAPH